MMEYMMEHNRTHPLPDFIKLPPMPENLKQMAKKYDNMLLNAFSFFDAIDQHLEEEQRYWEQKWALESKGDEQC